MMEQYLQAEQLVEEEEEEKKEEVRIEVRIEHFDIDGAACESVSAKEAYELVKLPSLERSGKDKKENSQCISTAGRQSHISQAGISKSDLEKVD
mmetsp:Transcript_15940/g.20139  ORF Transcript_15940/g.20139 Transcript_15940/m.20139 type:complete len:94 (-) Transcript_15940:693-974(-)